MLKGETGDGEEPASGAGGWGRGAGRLRKEREGVWGHGAVAWRWCSREGTQALGLADLNTCPEKRN